MKLEKHAKKQGDSRNKQEKINFPHVQNRKDVTVALREPSLGPVFGVKGGSVGGGYARLCRWKTSFFTLPAIFT